MSVEGVARKLSWSITKVEDIEYGDIRPHPQDVAALCGLYGADEHFTAGLVTLATYARISPWWWQTDHTPDLRAMETYPQLLKHAERILEYQPIVVPTLLQTEAYARVHLADTTGDPNILDQRVAARLDEARILTHAEPRSAAVDRRTGRGGPEAAAGPAGHHGRTVTPPRPTW
jgi:hypothetical protein